jgi:hypothetical protein
MNFGFQIKLELDLRYATYHIKKQKIQIKNIIELRMHQSSKQDKFDHKLKI